MLDRLNEANSVRIYSIFDKEFKTFGNIIDSIDCTSLIKIAEKSTFIPEEGNVYVPSFEDFEKQEVFFEIQSKIYGEMPIQIGYCNGRNSTYNGFEYHKGSELNIAVTDFMLVLGHTWQINENKFYVGDEKVFFVPKGTVIEMFQTTLHLSPCKVNKAGFKDIVVLPKNTNTPLDSKSTEICGEGQLLLQKNKWVIAHPQREALIKQGAFPGLIGENMELKY